MLTDDVGDAMNERRSESMRSGITFKRLYLDDDLLELEFAASDGRSSFSTAVYLAHEQLEAFVMGLLPLRLHGGGMLRAFQFGYFGPEYGNGAVRLRFHTPTPASDRVSITVEAESDWGDFKVTKAASSARLFLAATRDALSTAIDELTALWTREAADAHLAAQNGLKKRHYEIVEGRLVEMRE